VIVANAMLLSPHHGVVAFALSNSDTNGIADDLDRCKTIVEQVPPYVHSRLIRNRELRKNATQLSFAITPVVYAPFAIRHSLDIDDDLTVLESDADLERVLARLRTEAMPDAVFQELLSSIDGAKGLIRPKKRKLPPGDGFSKGKQAGLIEAAITNFDLQQKQGIMGLIRGPQRMRGLAGSGKTVVLAMKAALTHLQFPDARIAYTFYTKSLYQHVKRLITRFYRQFDDRDPDWEKRVHVLHGWGSRSTPGVYSEACESHGVTPLSFAEAGSRIVGDRFDFVCRELLKAAQIRPTYDYVFVDEGQDFPISFVRLCHKLATDGRFVLAYDDLQTLFQAATPSTAQIFGTNEDGSPQGQFEEDLVLHKCYRNPREVLVCAHALGFGLYGKKIVQMLENRDHWEDIGYRVVEGDCQEGNVVKVERPEENSLKIVSEMSGTDEIVKAEAFNSIDSEISHVAKSIIADIGDGLHPEDIRVVTVDDRHAKTYLTRIERALQGDGVMCNNLHSDTFGIQDFAKDGRVTLSTVHKAKGNEAFMVYVVGVDAVMAYADVKRRNMLFTAMTRAKGWVRVSGVGEYAERCVAEVFKAKANYPYLVFKYPSQAELKVMKRDLAKTADRKLKGKRLVEQLRQDFTDEEIDLLLREKASRRLSSRKGQRRRGT
jgi:superfamily I DNA and RNA helicase